MNLAISSEVFLTLHPNHIAQLGKKYPFDIYTYSNDRKKYYKIIPFNTVITEDLLLQIKNIYSSKDIIAIRESEKKLVSLALAINENELSLGPKPARETRVSPSVSLDKNLDFLEETVDKPHPIIVINEVKTAIVNNNFAFLCKYVRAEIMSHGLNKDEEISLAYLLAEKFLKKPTRQSIYATLSYLLAKLDDISDEIELIHIFLAAILCDIGKTQQSFNINTKVRTEFSSTQIEQYQKHPKYSEFLLKFTGLKLSNSVANLISQHHERIDGSGFPHGMKGSILNTNVQYLAVAENILDLLDSRAQKEKVSFLRAFQLVQINDKKIMINNHWNDRMNKLLKKITS